MRISELDAWGTYDQDNPFPLFAAVREEAPVRRVTLADGHPAWLITGFEEAKAALGDLRLSKNMLGALAATDGVVAEGLPGPAFAHHMLNADPPDHTRLRRLVGATFGPRRIEALRPHVSGLVDDLTTTLAAAGPEATVDLVRDFAFPLPITVIGELLGVAPEVRRPLGDWFADLLAPPPPGSGPGPGAAATRASATIVDYITGLIAAKRACPGDDIVSALIGVSDADGAQLDEAEIRSTILLLIVAGHDTTSGLIANGVVALLGNPAAASALRGDPSLIPAAVEELLRYDSPGVHATFRYTTEPVQYSGVTIPAGEQVLVCLSAANRDPHRFDAPDAIDLHREDNRHIAFGHGIHFCLGAPLARMESHLAFGALLARFPEMRLAVPAADLRWSHGDGIVLRGLAELPVILGPLRLLPH